MSKSIFFRLFVTITSLIVATFLLMIFFIGSILRNYAFDQNTENLQYIANSVKTSTEEHIFWNTHGVLNRLSYEEIRSIQKVTNAIVGENQAMLLFTDLQGKILFQAGQNLQKLSGEWIPRAVLLRAGEDMSFFTSDMRGLLAEESFIYAYPLLDAERETAGYLYAVMPVTAENELMSLMIQNVMIIAIWISLAALVAVYFVSDHTVRPLREIERVTERYAHGDLSERIAVRTENEVGQLSASINAMADSLQQLEDTRNSMIANISHDLRTPMTTISGFIEGITDGAIPKDKQDHYLKIVSAEVKRLSRMVNQVLDFSRIQSGSRKFSLERFDVCETARLVLISLESKIEAKELCVDFAASEENMYAYADPDAIHQVLYNLVENAVKFSREKGSLRVSVQRAAPHQLQISVYNEGEGVPEEDIPHLFDRFYKADKSRNTNQSGAGLGLCIVKSILNAHNEEIFVQSKEGSYCEFIFSLPEK